MHDRAVHLLVRELATGGIADAEISVRTGLARTTVRDIRRRRPADRRRCPRCWRPIAIPEPTPGDYAELLGFYLGDGYINAVARTYRLRISLDAKYPKVVAHVDHLVRRMLPHNRVALIPADGAATVVVSAYSAHLPCLLPQHGPGKKHTRAIALEPWQEVAVEAAPWSLLRGLLWSDGCCFVNRTGKYEYESFSFRNSSTQILDLFCAACAMVDVDFRRTQDAVRINRRASVARMLEHVGRKR